MIAPFALSAPASSANIGSGFDAVAIALELRMTARVRAAESGAGTMTFCGPEIPTHDGLRIVLGRALELGAAGRPAPPLDIEIDSAIPLGAGLGSSAAARALGIACALLATGAATERTLAAAVAPPAGELEGHVDNALAAVYGGIAVGVTADPGHFVRFAAPGDLVADVITPHVVLSTEESRTLLPPWYSRADTVENVGRAALLGAALGSGNWSVLRTATRDRLHQPYRARIYPWLDAAIAAAEATSGVYACTLSGAGPSIVALADRASSAEAVHRALRCAVEATGAAVAAVRRIPLAAAGLRVESYLV